MILPKKTLEKQLFKSGYHIIYGIDEVGMGCLAGPVVACAVGVTGIFYKKHHKKLAWLRESKLLPASQREIFSKELLAEKNLVYSVSLCHSKRIDKLNIYQAARDAMRRSLKKIEPSIAVKTIILVDGKAKIDGLQQDQMPIVKGDRKVFAIACASVIAKVFRDKMMMRYAKKYPGYGFEKHKGYRTKYHQIQLASLGPCAIHRKSFAPVAELL